MSWPATLNVRTIIMCQVRKELFQGLLRRDAHAIELQKDLGQTSLVGQSLTESPLWHWAD